MAKDIAEKFGALQRASMPVFDPTTIVIMGHDNDVQDHPLTDQASNAAPVDEGLVTSILKHGFKGAVSITLDPTYGTVAVDGRGRIRAAREANRRLKADGSDYFIRINAIPDKEKTNAYTMVLMNEHRRIKSPLTKAREADRLRLYGHSEAEISEAFSEKPSTQTLRNWQSLTALIPEAQAMLETGTLTLTAAYEMGRMSAAQQKATLAKAAPTPAATNVAAIVATSVGGAIPGAKSNGATVTLPKPARKNPVAAVLAAEKGPQPWSLKRIKDLAARLAPGFDDAPNAQENQAHYLLRVILGDEAAIEMLPKDLAREVRKV